MSRMISIHALLAESDAAGAVLYNRYTQISIHALLAESDATRRSLPRVWRNFYPRSPCGERRGTFIMSVQAKGISIHALLAESDNALNPVNLYSLNFYPRSPCGERPSNFASLR